MLGLGTTLTVVLLAAFTSVCAVVVLLFLASSLVGVPGLVVRLTVLGLTPKLNDALFMAPALSPPA